MEAGEKAGDTPDEQAVAVPEKAWLSSVTISDYPGIEGEVKIELSPRCTVLVGRNGAGKSLILDAIESMNPGWAAREFLLRRPIFRASSGVTRDEKARKPIFHRLSSNHDLLLETQETEHSSRLQRLSSAIARIALSPERADDLVRFQTAARRVRVGDSINLETYESYARKGNKNTASVCEVVLDGINIAFLSDATLRVLETLLQINDATPFTILLEEPETGIHPGLLSRLLRELKNYKGQVLISTHSPQVVSWAKPEDIRLVERHDGKTTIRSLLASPVVDLPGA